MKSPRRRSRDDATISATFDSVLTACTVVLLLASLGGLAALIAGLHIGLKVGDILVFKPGTELTDSLPVSATRIVAPRMGATSSGAAPADSCVLDPATMAHGGGSIVVETRSLTKPLYRVHWSGTRTSNGAQDCGRSADLTLSRMDLQSLVTAIGGFSFDSHGNVL